MLEPTWAELARTAVWTSSFGALATVDVDGRPAVGTVPIIDDGSGSPLTVLSNLSTHIIRGRQDQRAGMAIGDQVLVQGDLQPVPGLQQIELQHRFLDRHPHLAEQVESLDFSWLRLAVERVRWTTEDRAEHWLRPEDLSGAEPDPIAPDLANLVPTIAERLEDDLLLMVKGLAGRWLASDAELIHIDRYGLVATITEPSGVTKGRIPFPVRLDNAAEIHAAVGGLAAAGRSTPAARGENKVETLTRSAVRPIETDGNSLLAAMTADAGLLDSEECDSGSGPDVDGVDVPRHRDSYSLFDSLERAGREARALSPEEEGDRFIGPKYEVGDVDGIVGRSESDSAEPTTSEDVEPLGELVESGVGEGESLAHGDSA